MFNQTIACSMVQKSYTAFVSGRPVFQYRSALSRRLHHHMGTLHLLWNAVYFHAKLHIQPNGAYYVLCFPLLNTYEMHFIYILASLSTHFTRRLFIWTFSAAVGGFFQFQYLHISYRRLFNCDMITYLQCHDISYPCASSPITSIYFLI